MGKKQKGKKKWAKLDYEVEDGVAQSDGDVRMDMDETKTKEPNVDGFIPVSMKGVEADAKPSTSAKVSGARGNRTKAQKLRKSIKAERGKSFIEKYGARSLKKVTKKQARQRSKSLYS